MIAAEVKLWGTRIGAVSVDEHSPYCFFKYDPDFLKSGISPSPIMMPLSDEIFQFKTLPMETFHGLPGLLADVLPDRFGNALINAWLAKEGRSPESFNVIERLCYVGKRGMGAIEIFPDQTRSFNRVEEIEVDRLVELCNEILSQKEKTYVSLKEDMNELIKVGTSAGGARAKAVIAYNETTGVIKSGQIDAGKGFAYWLLKLDGVDQKEETAYTRIEYAYYIMAREAKITMSESRLLLKSGRYHFMTRRFDRSVLPDGTVEKRHMQTLGALVHVDYNEPGLFSYEEAAQTMAKLNVKKKDFEQFFRYMVFNVMAQNCDDHVKNISFLMDREGQWSLSPAYDLTYAYNPLGKWASMHQMSINGKRSLITREDLLKAAQSMRVSEALALSIIDDVKQALLKWPLFAKEAFLDEKTIQEKTKSFVLF